MLMFVASFGTCHMIDCKSLAKSSGSGTHQSPIKQLNILLDDVSCWFPCWFPCWFSLTLFRSRWFLLHKPIPHSDFVCEHVPASEVLLVFGAHDHRISAQKESILLGLGAHATSCCCFRVCGTLAVSLRSGLGLGLDEAPAKCRIALVHCLLLLLLID